MILADTSVWIDHFRRGEPTLAGLLEAGRVMTHPAVIGELALGGLKNRAEVMRLLADLPGATLARPEEVLLFIEDHRLVGSGVGYVDAWLLASTAITPDALFWSRDARAKAVASRLGFAFPDTL